MWPDLTLTELVSIDIPIIQAPTAGVATPALAAAVSNAGGLGSLGCAEMSVPEFRDTLAQTRAMTPTPVNANFFAHPEPATEPKHLAHAREILAALYTEVGLAETEIAMARLE